MDQVAHISASALNMNLSVLQRQDALITAIMGTATHVTVYDYDSSARAWSRRSCEGSLFIFQRSEAPFFGFFIMNRLSTENILEYADSSLEIEIAEPYILYRSQKHGIVGIWFYSAEEREVVAALLVE